MPIMQPGRETGMLADAAVRHERHRANIRRRVYRKQIRHDRHPITELPVAVSTKPRSVSRSVDQAIAKLLSLATPVAECETVDTGAAVGRVAGEDVRAPVDLPPFDCSAMDGYAIRAAGRNNTRPKRFRAVGDGFAGHPATAAVAADTTVRIFTGAVLPDGADAVLLKEEATERRGDVLTTAPVTPGQHVRRAGHDVSARDLLCAAGTRISAYHATWFAACGIGSVRVKRRVRVVVASTGDELAAPGAPLEAGQIYDCNRFALTTLLREKPVRVDDFGVLADDPLAIRAALGKAAQHADLIVTSGGVSVGDADYVQRVIGELGEVVFWRIALKPGKPLAVGRIGDALVIGLPGNPVSTLVTYLLFVAPTLDHLAGGAPAPPLVLRAKLEHAVRHTRGRREYMRGVMRTANGELVVSATGDQSSNRLATFAAANCLIIAKEDAGDTQSGACVEVLPLCGEAGHLLRG